jgi:hypothetical protein
MEIRDRIESLKDTISTEINENRLIRKGEELFNSLRKDWQTHKSQFKEADIRFLKNCSDSIEAIQEFAELLEDFPYISDKEDVDETIGELYTVVEKLEGLAVAARVNKEIRELLEKRERLPSRENRFKDAKLSASIARLNSTSKTCRKCGARMVIREGDGSFFWGCSTFPNCWGKSWLTSEELRIIEG